MQYQKDKFNKVYINRANYAEIYNDIYKSKKLEVIKSFLLKYYDVKVNDKYRIRLGEISNITNDSIVIEASNFLIKKEFHIIDLSYHNEGKNYEIAIWRTFLTYKSIPTRHRLIFTKSYEYTYRFSPNDYWFFNSSDVEPMKFNTFMDFRPEWTLPYFEAFTFFRENPNFKYEL